MSATFWKVFELAISVWENILLLEFCMDFMQQKPKGKKGKILWGIAVLFGLIFPALEKYPALYDRWEMWITLIWLFVYLMVGTQGSVLRKVTAAVVARAVLMMVNTAILFGGSFILQESVASFIQDQDTATRTFPPASHASPARRFCRPAARAVTRRRCWRPFCRRRRPAFRRSALHG